jgi:hypothetical protein
MHIIVIIALVVGHTACTLAAPIVDLKAIAGKAVAEVDQVLGEPSGTEETEKGQKRIYRGGQIEVTFINGIADWISVMGLHGFPFDEKAIDALGLKPAPAAFKDGNVIRWENYAGFLTISLFSDNGRAAAVYVNVNTK